MSWKCNTFLMQGVPVECIAPGREQQPLDTPEEGLQIWGSWSCNSYNNHLPPFSPFMRSKWTCTWPKSVPLHTLDMQHHHAALLPNVRSKRQKQPPLCHRCVFQEPTAHPVTVRFTFQQVRAISMQRFPSLINPSIFSGLGDQEPTSRSNEEDALRKQSQHPVAVLLAELALQYAVVSRTIFGRYCRCNPVKFRNTGGSAVQMANLK